MGWVPGVVQKNFDGGAFELGRLRVLRGVAGAASGFLGYARNDMGMVRVNHKGCPYTLGISLLRGISEEWRLCCPYILGISPGTGDWGWGWGRRVPGLSAPHHVIPSVAEESRRPPLTPLKTSRFLGYARNDMGDGGGNGMEGRGEQRGGWRGAALAGDDGGRVWGE